MSEIPHEIAHGHMIATPERDVVHVLAKDRGPKRSQEDFVIPQALACQLSKVPSAGQS